KKKTILGREIQDLENKLSKEKKLADSRNINDVETFYKKRKEASARLRAFYYSQKHIKRRRTYELQKRKYVDRLCSNERNYVTSGSKSIPIMFVGDRGYGIGSTIKGHARQGGLWKPKKHSLYSSVCITNEHNSSQTCIFYCYTNYLFLIK
ncbi:hypothetical protein BDF21DRAFT_332254, partial [Thamnidium elegans]